MVNNNRSLLKLADVEKCLEENTLEDKILKKEYALEEYQFVEIPLFKGQAGYELGLDLEKINFQINDFSNGIVFTYNNEAIAIYYLKDKDDELLSVKTTFPKILE